MSAIKRSFSLEPGEQHISDLRIIPLSSTPWVSIADLNEIGRERLELERLERIAPSDSKAAERGVYAPVTVMSPPAHQYSHSRSMSQVTLTASGPSTPYAQYASYNDPHGQKGFSDGVPLLQSAFPLAGVPSPGFPMPQYLNAVDIRKRQDEKAELETSGPPAWLGVFFDLSWTVIFANLSNSTELKTFITLVNYTIMFGLAWFLWAAHTLYDVKYYTNDWFHRILLILQLVTFATLSAFTKDFDAFNELIDPHAVPDDQFAAVNYSRKCNLGISGLFACVRLMLVICYLRVILHLPRHPTARAQRKILWLQTASYTVSALIFTGAFIAVKFSLHPSVRWIKLTLWALGFIVEVLVHLFVPEVDGRLLLNVDTMGERISGLATIILGEGLNSLGQTLILMASSTGFNLRMGLTVFAVGLVVMFSFLLYFDGLKRRTPGTRRRSRMNVLLHFPVHLAIIVLLQSLKNSLIYSAVVNQVNWFIAKLSVTDSTSDASVKKAFRNIGLNFEGAVLAMQDRQQRSNGGQATSDLDFTEIKNMLVAQAVLSIFQNFDIVSDDMDTVFTDYIYTFNGTARTDNTTSLDTVSDAVLDGLRESSAWVPTSAGFYLVFLALIAIVNAWVPKHRYIWIAAISRAAMGLLVIGFFFAKFNNQLWKDLLDQGWLGGIVATAFIAQFLIDQILIVIAVNKHKLWRKLGYPTVSHAQ